MKKLGTNGDFLEIAAPIPINRMEKQLPKNLGFHMPAEWEKHSAIWLAWPYDDTTFPGRVEKAENVFVKMIKALYETEKVELLVLNEAMLARASALLKANGVDAAKINFHVVDYADVWTRDYGPTFIINKKTKECVPIKWQYNAYGKADDPYFGMIIKDNEVFLNLKKTISEKMFDPQIVMEGGSIEVNGCGTLITTEQCLLNPNRNPSLTKNEIEKYLSDYLGVNKIIWLKQGLVNDHTDGHIDDIARFIAPNKILVAYEEDEKDENFKILDDNYQVLKNAVDQNGKPFEVVKLPMPHMYYDAGHSLHSTGPVGEGGEEAEKAIGSYCNFYIGNQAVLVPIYNDVNDNKALQIIQSCFPDREVIGIDCSDIIYGGGAIHCMTQQQPAA